MGVCRIPGISEGKAKVENCEKMWGERKDDG